MCASAAKMSKLYGASVCEKLRGRRSRPRLGRAKGPAAPPEAGGVGGADRPEGGAAPPEVGGAKAEYARVGGAASRRDSLVGGSIFWGNPGNLEETC